MVRNLVDSRELIWQLFKRDLLASSQQSILGLLWIVIAPIIGILSWVLMSQAGVLQPGALSLPYPLYVLVGATIWGFFMSFYSAAASSLTSAGGLLVQAKFAHEALVAQQLAQTLIAIMANIVLLFAACAVFGSAFHWTALLFPLTLVPLLLLGTGIGMVVSVLAVLVKDMTRVVTTLLGLTMFLTPVIYAPEVRSEWLQQLVSWNPLTYLVGGARDLVLSGYVNHPTSYAYSVLLAIAAFLLAWRLFFVSEQRVAEKL